MKRLIAIVVCSGLLELGCATGQQEASMSQKDMSATTSAQLAGYSLAFVNVADMSRYRTEYGRKAFPLVNKHGGMLLAATTEGVVKEGSFPTKYLALIEWPSLKAGIEFFDDPDYDGPVKPLREALGTSHIGLFGGMTPQRDVQEEQVYFIAFVEVTDAKRYQDEYVRFGKPLIEKHGGIVRVAAPATDVVFRKGDFPPGLIMVAEFPDMAAMEAFYSDPDYQPLIPVRQSIGKSTIGFFPGMAPRRPTE